MTEYNNENRGVLFKNDRKESDKHPDYKGNINVNGVEFWLSAWIKEGAKGKFMSLSIQPKEASVMAQAAQPAQSISQRAMPKGPAKRSAFPDDDIGGDLIPF